MNGSNELYHQHSSGTGGGGPSGQDSDIDRVLELGQSFAAAADSALKKIDHGKSEEALNQLRQTGGQ